MTKDYVSARPDTGMLFFVRRVPKQVAHLDGRGIIRESLRTRDPVIAGLKARVLNEGLEQYWGALLRGEAAETSLKRYRASVDLARSFGFTYQPASVLSAAGLTKELGDRIFAAEEVIGQKASVDALLGGTPAASLRLSELYTTYAEHKETDLSAMSPRQRRHHEGQRKRSISYATEVLGDPDLASVTRADVLRFRQWWISKMDKENLTVEAPNKSFSNIKGMLTVVDDALQTQYGKVWEKLNIKPTKKTRAQKRLPYTNEFIQDHLLAPHALDGLNLEARCIIYIMTETGLRPSEVVNLRPADIVLDHKIPHVLIEEREDRVLKTEASVRSIPLVGAALWAAKQRPGGFDRYRDNADAFSAAANKFLSQNGLRPSPQHTVYSLRHSFQDRILAAKALDRVQADLMGHAFSREVYGEGATLAAKLEVLNRIKFKWDMATTVG